MPKDPWNNVYQYASPGANGRDYDIISYGRDGKPGGEGYDSRHQHVDARSEVTTRLRAGAAPCATKVSRWSRFWSWW